MGASGLGVAIGLAAYAFQAGDLSWEYSLSLSSTWPCCSGLPEVACWNIWCTLFLCICERGVRCFDFSLRSLLDCAAICASIKFLRGCAIALSGREHSTRRSVVAPAKQPKR